jgi:hypothetical protein
MKLVEILQEVDLGRMLVTIHQGQPVYISSGPQRGEYSILEPGKLLAHCADAYELVRAANQLYPHAEWELMRER